ncbi:uncharacterized protein DSM5745_01834 [Aspergillus mulundensis]|uniref:Uncharacterized protein n=1 Tax=Aspergillus mulundensis TaxID=1810919 RepID=A0A3D8SUW5_9EURO|nr:Uncharacterized protein DSM5745_01834 [Aspergillus mulundensis]RDW90059.1 Uncharacterized protein DSM5745_01834 [Aspergillus mulundensis]
MADAPQWQIDITGLSQLIFSAGAHGLKQLALAGVDPHTIGCMLMIAEYTPASQDFRTKLSKARQQQRMDRLWLHKLVEIGASTNFLADQMLKTRAGENVVALMAAVATVMDEQNCTAVLLSLFEAAKASLDNTPGILQLQNIRKCLASLASKMGFSEKTLQYHHFFLSLLGRKDEGESQRPKESPYEGLPDVKDMPKMIQLMHRLIISEDGRCVVRYTGLRGAAWMATYASYILGLRICAVTADGTAVPMTSSYEGAQVIFEVSAPESTGGLYQEGDLQDLISLETAPVSINSGWRVDCSVVDFVNLHHPDLRQSQPAPFSRISTFAAIELLNEISTFSQSFDPVESPATWYRSQYPHSKGFLSFTQAALPDIQARALRILKILGFRPPESGYRFRPHGEVERYSCYGHESDPMPLQESYSDAEGSDNDDDASSHSEESKGGFFKGFKKFGRRQREGPKRTRRMYESRRGQYVERGNLSMGKDTDLERLKYYLDDHTDPVLHRAAKWRRETFRDLLQSITVAVHFASRLAFTDWDVNLRIMSAMVMSYRELPPPRVSHNNSRHTNFEGHIHEAIELCSDSMPIESIEQRLWTADWMGLDIDGIVILRNAAMPDSWASMKGAYLGFRRGRILHENQQYTKIRTDRINTQSQNLVATNKKSWTTAFPMNGCPSIEPRALIMPMADTIFLRLEASATPGSSVIGDGSLSALFTPDYIVTAPCKHGYDPKKTPVAANYPLIEDFAEGLFFDDSALLDNFTRSGTQQGVSVFYQLTSENKLAQWLASQWRPASGPFQCLRIIQRDCCLQCLLGNLGRVLEELNSGTHFFPYKQYPVCIMAGKEEGP